MRVLMDPLTCWNTTCRWLASWSARMVSICRSRLLFRISQVTVEPDDEAVDMYNVPIEEGALILQL